MRRRVSIARLMFVIGLSALAMTVLRAWIAPRNHFGFLGLMAWMVLVTLIAGLVTSGLNHRFFCGAGSTAAVLWVVILLAPAPILGSSWDYLLYPVARWGVPRPSPSLDRLQYARRGADLGLYYSDARKPSLEMWVQRRAWICGGLPDLQALLLIPPASLAVLGGLIASRYRPRTTVSLSPADRP